MSLRICILETDVLRPEFIDQYQGYGQMFKRLFSEQPIAAQFTIFNVVSGQYPSDDEVYDAYLVTGSKADSFGTDPWIQTLKEYLLTRYERGDKLLGFVLATSCWRYCWEVRASGQPKAGAWAPTNTNWPPKRRG